MMLMPVLVGELSARFTHLMDVALIEVIGTIQADASSHPKSKEIGTRFLELFRQESIRQLQTIGTDTHTEIAAMGLKTGAETVKLLSETSASSGGIEAILFAELLGMWTAFETMAGDLWETALNRHPAGLAELKGVKNRIGGRGRSKGPAADTFIERTESKTVPLNRVQQYQFDLRTKMGTILRDRFNFSRLEGIREAYSVAFFENSTQIDTALSNNALDALSAVRNVIVHRSAIVDLEYRERARNLHIPNAEAGKPLLLDGETVVRLIRPALKCSTNLLSSVDDWISGN